MRRSRHGEAGVTIVEAAFVIPLLFMFIFGLVDLGMWTLNSNQASNAARDGARAGILAYPLRGADLVAADAAARETIVNAIQKRLPEGTVDDSQITVTCQDLMGVTVPCTHPSPDRVKVDVAWAWTLVTPVATMLSLDEGKVAGSATMEIVGRPIAVGPPPSTTQPPDPLAPTPSTACQLAELKTPGTVYTKGKQLTAPMLITFKVTGDCTDLRVILQGTRTDTPEKVTHFCGCGDGPTDYSWTYEGSNNIWVNNGKQGSATVMDGSTQIGSTVYFLVK